MPEETNQTGSNERLRVLRIAHASLTPALRERERALAKECADIDLEVLTTTRWREAGVDVYATADDLFQVSPARACLSNHIQLFAYDPRPVVRALRRHRPHLIDLNHEPYSIACAEILALADWLLPGVPVVMQVAQNILRQYPPPVNWLQNRALRRIAAAYACSEGAREVLHAKGFQKPISIIPFGVNTETFRPGTRRRKGATLTIGFVGRMLPGKGLGVLADALTNLALDRSSRRRRVAVLVTFDRLPLKWIAHGGFRVHERRDRTPEPGVFLPIISETLQIRFQSAFPAAPLTKVDSDGLNQQLIDRTAFDFAEVFQRVTFLSFNSQSESSSAHVNSLRRRHG